MENQQEIIQETELAWLAGIIEADGYMAVCCVPATKKRKEQGRTLVIRVGITNSDALIIEQTQKLFRKLGFDGYMRTSKILNSGKVMCALETGRLNQVLVLLTRLLPYFSGSKAASARLLIQFVQSRLSRMYQSYTNTEIDYIRQYDVVTPETKGKIRKNLKEFLRDYTPDIRVRDNQGRYSPTPMMI